MANAKSIMHIESVARKLIMKKGRSIPKASIQGGLFK
jgi:hypothetical protein